LKPFDVFICHKKSSGKDFADHLKAGLEELGYHSFLDSKDIPKMVDGVEEWAKIRDQALKESQTFILIITPAFDLSPEVRNELKLARQLGHKQFIYFRHRDLARKIVVDLDDEKLDLGKQEQVSFETKEELLRLAHGILLKSGDRIKVNQKPPTSIIAPKKAPKEEIAAPLEKAKPSCAMCLKPIEGQPFVELIGEKTLNFDSKECARTFRKFRSVYGEDFQ
jgi:hypothetical protein